MSRAPALACMIVLLAACGSGAGLGHDGGGPAGGSSDASTGGGSSDDTPSSAEPDTTTNDPATSGETGTTPDCGDQICAQGETCATCPADCGACPLQCGDGTCAQGETCANCPEDCGACPLQCGDGTCDQGEGCANCPEDCGACPVRCGDGTCAAPETCGDCPGDCGACVPVFDDPPVPGVVSDDLTCDFPWAQALDSVVQVGRIGGAVTSVVGVDDRFGGVGAKFELLNNAAPGNYVNVLEPRSGAGAGWQTSFLVEDWPQGVGIIVFNQAAGNSTGYQWGHGGVYTEDGKNIFAATWNPLDSDHIHLKPDVHSPCEQTGYLFDDGAVDVLGTTVATPHGAVVVWKNQYRYRSRVDQSWPSWSAEQAFYLSRPIARAGGLRLYLRRGETRHGPFAPHDLLDIPEATCPDSHCNTGAYDYAVLVWNIFGLDIGVAIPDLARGTSINLEKTTYCGDPGDDACGNINFHSWVARVAPAAFAAGEVRTLSQLYYVGTLPQLADLGFEIW